MSMPSVSVAEGRNGRHAIKPWQMRVSFFPSKQGVDQSAWGRGWMMVGALEPLIIIIVIIVIIIIKGLKGAQVP